MNQAILDPIRGGSLGAMVADSVRSAIYAGRFKPGDAIGEMQIARELRVSQTTVREALLQLEHAGLVVREANRGTRITMLSDEDVRERITIRVVLETSAAIEAARRITPSELAEIENRKRQLATAIRRNQYYEAAQLDLAFHRIIWRACGNRTLFRMLDDLTAPTAHPPEVPPGETGEPQTAQEAHSGFAAGVFIGAPIMAGAGRVTRGGN